MYSANAAFTLLNLVEGQPAVLPGVGCLSAFDCYPGLMWWYASEAYLCATRKWVLARSSGWLSLWSSCSTCSYIYIYIGMHLHPFAMNSAYIHSAYTCSYKRVFAWKTSHLHLSFLSLPVSTPMIRRLLLLMLARLREIGRKMPRRQAANPGLTLENSKVWIHPSPSKCHPQDVEMTPAMSRFVDLGVHRCSWTSSSRRALTLLICDRRFVVAVSGKWVGQSENSRIWETSSTHSHAITCIFCEAWFCVDKAPDWQAYWAQVPRLVINFESPSGWWNQWSADARWCIYIYIYLSLYLSILASIGTESNTNPSEHYIYSLQLCP